MFGRQTRKQLARALETLNASIEMAKNLASCLEETELQRTRAMALLDQSRANAETWRRIYEKTQNRDVVDPALGFKPTYCRWVN